MSDQVFKNLGKFMSYEEKVISSGKPSKIMIKYTQPNYQDPKKVWEVGVFEDKIEESLLEKIVSLSSGEEICVHTVKNDKGYADLKDITDAKDAPAKSAGGNSQYKNKKWTPKDESGNAVGGAWKYAIDILINGLDVNEVKALVDIILPMTEEQKERLQAKTKAKEETKAEPKKSKLEEMKEKKAAEASKKKTTATKKKAPPKDEEEDYDIEDDDVPELDEVEDLDDIPMDEE